MSTIRRTERILYNSLTSRLTHQQASAHFRHLFNSQIPASRRTTPIHDARIKLTPCKLKKPCAAAQSPSPIRYSRKTTGIHGWVIEIIASIISCLSLAGIAAILVFYDGQPLTNLRITSTISLNALVNIFSTISRLTLLLPTAAIISQDIWIWFSDTRLPPHRRGALSDIDIHDAASRGAIGSIFSSKKSLRSEAVSEVSCSKWEVHL
jgi:hypothetical protein